MDSLDILHTVNTVAIGIDNLRFCNTLSLLDAASLSIRDDLDRIRPFISHSLFVVLQTELRITTASQTGKIKGIK